MPVRSHSTFCQYLLDMSPLDEEFLVDNLPFVGRNKVIYRVVTACHYQPCLDDFRLVHRKKVSSEAYKIQHHLPQPA
jgi:hypothetical protein